MEAADITGTTFEEVDKCHGSAEGESLLHDIGVETANLDPPLYFIPWILLDEVNPFLPLLVPGCTTGACPT